MREIHSNMAHLLRAVMPRDPETCVAENLERLQDAANGARWSLASGLAVFGKCLIREEAARELSTEDVTNLGDFLITTAEMLLELEELEVQTRDALARLRAAP
jgi:hypothetical protein